MDILNLEEFLLWNFIINYAILLVWFLVMNFASDFIYGMHSKWYHVSREKFDSMNYTWMGFYKLFIFIFNLAPYIAMQIIK